jgi:glycosyltransferase involved in cell wall biosynthesis
MTASDTLPPSVPVILLASACWETPTPVNAHQIALRMAARGHRVLFVESTGLRSPALVSSHDRQRMARRLADWRAPPRQVVPRLWVLSPLALPWGWPGPARHLSLRWIERTIRAAARRLDLHHPVVWSFLPTYATIAPRLDGRLVLYHCVDHYAANPGVPRGWVDRMEQRMLARADVVFATSPVLAARLRQFRSRPIELVPNVADVPLFSRAVTDDLAEPPALATLPRPRAVYVGNLAAYRVDVSLLEALAVQLPDVQFVIIGAIGLGDIAAPPAALRSLLARPNVHTRSAVPQAELPAWLRHCDAALVPFLDNEHTRGSLPMKLWEYIAAGLPVVATDLPNFAEAASSGAAAIARTADEFAARIRDALHEGPDRRAWRSNLARPHDWAERIDQMCRIIAHADRQLHAM